jgi:ABC-type nitrate/sulfonate/bicarbonate transport system permease component
MADAPASPPSRPVRLRAGGFTPRDVPAASVATLVALLALWQVAAWLGWMNTAFLSDPVAIARTLGTLATSGQLWLHLKASLWRLAVGWSLGTVAGLAVGFAAGLFTLARSPAMAVVSALFPVPKIALVPLFIIWFGIGEGSKVATLAFGVFFPTVIGTVAGVDGVARGLVRMGQSFGLPWHAVVTKIVLPGAVPALLSSFRITSSTAIVLLVAAEMIGAERGIGAFVLSAGNLYDIDGLLSGIVVLSAIGLVIALAISRAERALLGWR